ncbi:MAG: PAS domain S-box protein [Cyclobacteriaceae bacterium]|nr:PAS domain S-box protein [Cyclobacteriaceae bacterium]
MNSAHDFALKYRFKHYSKLLMGVAILIGALILLGWAFDIAFIKHSFSNTPTMNPTSAVCFILLAVSFLIIHSTSRNGYVFACSLSIAVIIVGLLRLADFLLGTHFGIDGFLFPGELQSELPGVISNRMAPNTAFNFSILASAVLLTSLSNDFAKRIANLAVLLAILVALFAIIGYLYSVKESFGLLYYVPMALQSAITFLLVATAILFTNTERGFMSVISSSYSGGTIARLLIPAAIVSPVILGYLKLIGQAKSPITDELGVSVVIVAFIILFFLIILQAAFIINNKDIEQKKIEDKLALLNLSLEQKILDRTEEIYRNERRYRSLIENSAEGISLFDRKLVPTYQSPGVFSITGYTFEERRLMSGLDSVHPDDREDAQRLFATLLENPGKSFNFQYRSLHKNGNHVWVEGIASNLLDDRDVQAIIINYRNITERKEAEVRQTESEQRLRSILDSSADAIAITDENLRTKYQNPAVERLTGISLEYRLAHPDQRFIHPEDAHLLKDVVDSVFKEPGKAFPFQVRVQHRKGHGIWIEGVVTNLMNDKNVNGITFTYRDITDRKNFEEKLASNEQRFRVLIENIVDAIVLNDEDSNILYQSPSVTRILGYTLEERISRPVLEYVHPENKEDFLELYRKLKLQPGLPLPFQYRFLHKNGNYIWLEGVVTNLMNDPTVRAYVANYRDVSQRKESEEEILNLNNELENRVTVRTKQLQELNQELEAFTYSISHDLRAPLRIMNGFGQILLEDYSHQFDSEGQVILGRIMRNAKRMGQLIDDLLNFSRLGRAELTISEVNMNNLVKEVVEELVVGGTMIPEKFKLLKLPPAKGDFNLLKQVWINLLSNAIKYSGKKDQPMIEVGSLKQDDKTVYYVKDNGNGFDMQYYSKLFGVFQRLHKESEFSGTGVGLALVQRIIARHGGTVWAEGKPLEGAVFYFNLPS